MLTDCSTLSIEKDHLSPSIVYSCVSVGSSIDVLSQFCSKLSVANNGGCQL